MRGLLEVLALVLCFPITVLGGANNIIGSVRDQSRGQPTAGDEVILIRLESGMQEEARAKTDSQGAFTFNVQNPDQTYLVRVVHRGVSYDQEAPPAKLSLSKCSTRRRMCVA